jgi:hypothetical protein
MEHLAERPFGISREFALTLAGKTKSRPLSPEMKQKLEALFAKSGMPPKTDQ